LCQNITIAVQTAKGKNMGTSVQLNLIDKSAERTSVRIPTATLTGASATELLAFEADFADLVASLTLLSPTGTSVNGVNRESYTLPDDAHAIREVAVRFVCEDANANQVSFSIGGPNLDYFPFETGNGGDVWEYDAATAPGDLSGFVEAALVVARHPISGLTLTCKRLELVGRNN
jgi:hypothetical protein